MTYRRALEEGDIVWLEGRVSHHNIAGLTRLSQHLEGLLTAGERLFGVEPFVRLLESRAVYVASSIWLVLAISRCGRKWLPWAKPGEFRGRTCYT